MAPRQFNNYMIAIGMGTHPKLARLDDSERCAHVFGVLAIAAMSPIRGHLLVGELPAEAVDVAAIAGVTEKVARTAMRKLEAVGVLRHDADMGCLEVHDWGDVNPPPRSDSTAADRQQKRRDKLKAERDCHAAVTLASRRDDRDETVTVTPPEVEVEEEHVNSTVGPRPDRGPSGEDLQAVFDAWIEGSDRTERTLFDAKRKRCVKAAYRLGFDRGELCDAVRGWRNSPHHRGENDTGTVYNDLGLLLRDSAHIEKFRDLQRRPLNLAARTGQVESSSDFLARRGWA